MPTRCDFVAESAAMFKLPDSLPINVNLIAAQEVAPAGRAFND
jgi:hypothetical protein